MTKEEFVNKGKISSYSVKDSKGEYLSVIDVDTAFEIMDKLQKQNEELIKELLYTLTGMDQANELLFNCMVINKEKYLEMAGNIADRRAVLRRKIKRDKPQGGG